MTIRKVQPLKTSSKAEDTSEKEYVDHIPTYDPGTVLPVAYEPNEFHNLATPYNQDDPAR